MERRYPQEFFGSLWHKVAQLAASGRVCVCDVVVTEIERGVDSLGKWVNEVPGLRCAATSEEMVIAADISKRHPGWVHNRKNEGDPFVIAHAIVHQRTIVTEERKAGRGVAPHNLKVPNVAEEHRNKCIQFFDFLRDCGWSF